MAVSLSVNVRNRRKGRDNHTNREGPQTTHLRRSGCCRSMAVVGQEEPFPPPRLSAGYAFRKETIAGMRRNGRDAPIAVIRASADCDELIT